MSTHGEGGFERERERERGVRAEGAPGCHGLGTPDASPSKLELHLSLRV